ncbi:MAG: hypothetical protein L0207_03500 [Chlamydiae bacterium]|nr:hypothetical protein [Chlamydiota bacterium]
MEKIEDKITTIDGKIPIIKSTLLQSDQIPVILQNVNLILERLGKFESNDLKSQLTSNQKVIRKRIKETINLIEEPHVKEIEAQETLKEKGEKKEIDSLKDMIVKVVNSKEEFQKSVKSLRELQDQNPDDFNVASKSLGAPERLLYLKVFLNNEALPLK